MRRRLTLIDCFGLGINGLVGSGIFLLPAALYQHAGSASPIAWILVGGLCTLVALCFAEAAGTTDRSGGPYRYACDAFGERVGFLVGWITLTSSLLGYAAVSRGFADHAAYLLHGLLPADSARGLVIVVLVFGLGLVNVLGVKPSARMADGVAIGKMIGLMAFVAIGLVSVRRLSLMGVDLPSEAPSVGVGRAAFAGLFACTGFEYVPVPAGETQDPRRSVAVAMVASVIGATVLYVFVQMVAVGAVGSALASADTPLVDAARAIAGSWGANAIAWIALLSAFGFCSGSALVGPRYLESFAQDGFLPRPFARRVARLDTPAFAVLASSLVVAAMAVSLDFRRLADVSSLAVVVQYASTCAAVLVMRRRDLGRTQFRLPLGPTIPLLALAGSLLFLLSVSRAEWLLSFELIGGGLLLALFTRLRARV